MACLGAVTGCRWPGESAPTRHWILSSSVPVPATETFVVSVGLGPILLPDYLNRPELVERMGPNQLRAHDFDLWGERLDVSFRNVLADDLASLVPGLAVVPFPWKGASAVDYRVSVLVSRFEFDVPSNAVVLIAGWGLAGSAGPDRIAAKGRTIRVPVEGNDIAAITAGMSRAVGELAQAMAEDLRDLPELRPEASPQDG